MANRDYIDYFSTDAETFLYDLTEILTDDELAKIGEENIITIQQLIKPVFLSLLTSQIRR